MTVSADGVTCATADAPDAPADVPPVLTLPILDEIEAGVTVGTSGSSLSAVQAAVRLLDWGVNTLEMWMDHVGPLSGDCRVLRFDYPQEPRTDRALAAGLRPSRPAL